MYHFHKHRHCKTPCPPPSRVLKFTFFWVIMPGVRCTFSDTRFSKDKVPIKPIWQPCFILSHLVNENKIFLLTIFTQLQIKPKNDFFIRYLMQINNACFRFVEFYLLKERLNFPLLTDIVHKQS